jgi:hypothetical protein
LDGQSRNFALANVALSECYEAQGKHGLAVDAEAKELTAFLGSESAQELQRAYKAGGIKGARQWLIAQDSDRAKPLYNPANAAANYALLGDKDNAFLWLEKAFQRRDSQLIFLKSDIVWDNLRSDPRYTALLRRIGLPQ